MYLQQASSTAHFIKADYSLQTIAGSGSLDPFAIDRAQFILEEAKHDFAPLVEMSFYELEDLFDSFDADAYDTQENKDALGDLVLHLKSMAGVCDFQLISELSAIMLRMIDHATVLDSNLFSLAKAYKASLSLILSNVIKGDGGVKGMALKAEFLRACNRYMLHPSL